MSDKKKISVIILGRGDSLKKALITNILGKDLSQLSKRPFMKETEIYENDTYELTCTPDLYTACEEIRELFAVNRHPDMSLLVVEDGFSTEDVLKQIEKLKETTGKQTDEFIIMLPLSYKHTFNVYTMEQVFSKLSKLAGDKNLMLTNKRHADPPDSVISTPASLTVGSNRKEHFTDPKKSLKRKRSGTKVNLVLLGLAGTGKSESGNTILGRQQFMSRASSNPVTKDCQVAETVIDGTHVRVIDTPDIFDDEIKSSIKEKHVRKCTQLCQPGPCVYLLVMQVSRFTDGERDILRKLEEAFGRSVQEQTIILFTRRDDLQRDNVSLEEFLRSCQPDLKKIVAKCNERCVFFENRASGSGQVEELMQTVDRVINNRNNNCASIRPDQ